jgi:hypothetical protein
MTWRSAKKLFVVTDPGKIFSDTGVTAEHFWFSVPLQCCPKKVRAVHRNCLIGRK